MNMFEIEGISRYTSILDILIKKLTYKIDKDNLYPEGLKEFDFNSGRQTEKAFQQYEKEILELRRVLIESMFEIGAYTFEMHIYNEKNSPLKYSYISQSMGMIDDLYLYKGENISGNLSAIIKQCVFDIFKAPKNWKEIYVPTKLNIKIDKILFLFTTLIDKSVNISKNEKELILKNKEPLLEYISDKKELSPDYVDDDFTYIKLAQLTDANYSRVCHIFENAYSSNGRLVLSDADTSICFEFINRFFKDIKKICG